MSDIPLWAALYLQRTRSPTSRSVENMPMKRIYLHSRRIRPLLPSNAVVYRFDSVGVCSANGKLRSLTNPLPTQLPFCVIQEESENSNQGAGHDRSRRR